MKNYFNGINKRVLLVCLTILLIFLSCKKNSDKKLTNDTDFIIGKSILGEKLTSHFPVEYGYTNYSVLLDTLAFHTNSLYMGVSLSGSNAEKSINRELIKYKEKRKYSDNDSCVVVLNDFINNENLIDVVDIVNPESNEFRPDLDYTKEFKSKLYKSCNSEYVVIPNFWSPQATTSRSHLNNNYRFIIIDAETSYKKVWSVKIDSTKSFMPDSIRHGYSRGIAFNQKERIVIYWAILW